MFICITKVDVVCLKDFVEVFAPHVLEAEDMDATTRATLINDYIQVKAFTPKFSTSGQL